MNLITNITERMSTKINVTMNTIYKLVVVFSIIMVSTRGYSQRNADPGIGILMAPPSVTQGDSGTLSAAVGNYGNSTIVANSLRVTISVGTDAEIIGIASGSDPRWTLLSMTTGSGNTIRLKNTAGGFSAFDVGDIILTVRGNVVSGADLIFGNIVYITASNPLLCGICPPTPLNASQGNASTSNDNSQTSLAVTASIIDAVVDTFPSQTPGTTVATTVGNVTTNDTLNGVPVTASNTDVTPVTTGPLSIDATGVLTLAPNTPSGSYSITYTICEVNPTTGIAVSPANCDSVTDTVVVLAPIIDAVTETITTPINGHTGGSTTVPLTNNDTLNNLPVVIGAGGNVTISIPNPLPIGLTLNTSTGIVTVGPNTPAGTYPVVYTICEVLNPSNCDTVTSFVEVFVTDFTPTIDIDNVVFLTSGVTRDFVVNISEIESSASVGQIVFKIPKQSAFAITYDATATISNVSGGTAVNNNDWIFSENTFFITVTLKPGLVIDASTFSSIGFKISRKANVPNQTWQPITATIVSGSGSDSVNENNTYNVLVKAQ